MDERIVDNAHALKKLFKIAYPGEEMTSAVLLQRFLTGLQPEISRQLLLRKKPATFAEALEAAVEIEYAFKRVRITGCGATINEIRVAAAFQNSLASLKATLQRS